MPSHELRKREPGNDLRPKVTKKANPQGPSACRHPVNHISAAPTFCADGAVATTTPEACCVDGYASFGAVL
eukprot:5159712-Amphidinium_carterae.1